MLRRVLKYIRDNRLLEPSDRVLVCVSGGADSVALLDILLRGGYECIVAHCNFHLRDAESDRDEQFVGGFCAKRKVTLICKSFATIDEANRIGKSIELTARTLRYKWFDEIARKYDCKAIAVAHHQNDQAETLIMNLRRGAGIRGLCGMRAKSKNPCAESEISIIRPLLCTTHDYICHYLKNIRKIGWVEDSSNQDITYRRNMVRQELQTYQKSEIEHIAATARMMQGYWDWLSGKESKEALEVKQYEREKQMRKHYGLIGTPLIHSYSAKIFEDKFHRENINADYKLFDTQEKDLSEILTNKQMNGWSVTYPYKEKILPYLCEVDDIAREIGSVNTLYPIYKNGTNAEKVLNGWKGYNTDWIGFRDALRSQISHEHDEKADSTNLAALILGTGGAAKAVAHALTTMHIRYSMVSHSGRGDLSYNDLTEDVVRKHLLIVQCTPLGMYPEITQVPPFPTQWISNGHIIFDCIYNPEKTLFMQLCEKRGAKVFNGLDMLKNQANEAWKIWNDKL